MDQRNSKHSSLLRYTLLFVIFCFVQFRGSAQADLSTVYVYYPNGHLLQYVSADGGTPTTVLDAGAQVWAIALDSTNNHVYWFDTANNGEIRRAVADGTNPTTIISGLSVSSVYGMALDVPSQKIYFTDYASNKLFSVNFDGSGLTTLLSGLNGPIGIDLDLTNSYIYFGEHHGLRIRRCTLTGASLTDLITGGDYIAVTVNPTESKLYYADYTNNTVIKADTDGSNASVIISSGLDEPFNMAIHRATSQLFIPSIGGTRYISKASLDGSGLTTVISGISGYPLSLAVANGLVLPTPTPTATWTGQPASTSTPTSTPTDTPAPTITATPIASATPTTAPIPTPTGAVPTATPNPRQVEIVITVEGQPVADALVYCLGVGTCLTDQSGKCSIAGLEEGKVYQATVQKTGLSFAVPEFSLRGGQTITVAGARTSYNTQSCPESEQSTGLNNACGLVREIATWATADFERLRASNVKEICPKVSTASLLERVDSQYISYMNASKVLPEICLDCTGKTGCASQKLTSQKSRMLVQLRDIRHEALLANRVLRKHGKRSDAASDKRIKAIMNKGTKAKAAIRKLTATTWVCDSQS